MAHPLLHWRHRVNESVLQRLRQDGHFSREKIIERDGWRAKKRSEYANKVVDELEENRVMREFYEDFKIPLELARDAKVSHFATKQCPAHPRVEKGENAYPLDYDRLTRIQPARYRGR